MFVIELMQEFWLRLKPKPQSGRSRTRAQGDEAEAFALAFLKKECGFRLIEQSMSDEDGELDLVGRVKGVEGLVVVEVRARKQGGMVSPRDAVDHNKQVQVVQTARRLLPRRGFHEVLRFDVVGVYLDARGKPLRAEHFPAAFDRRVLQRR